jgi:DNA-directed RNA polymerase subunit L
MEIEILKDEKNILEVKIEELTIVELLKVYLNKDSGVEFVAWKREHPTESPILRIETKGKTAKKAIKDAISVVEKELDSFEKDFSKLK